MPKIPTQLFSGRISPEVRRQPTQSLASARAIGQSIQRVGAGVTQAGAGIGGLIEARQQAEDEAFFSSMKEQDRAEDVANKKTLDEEFSGTSYNGYVEKRQEFYEGQKEKYLERATSERQKQLIDLHYDGKKTIGFESDDLYKSSQARMFYNTQLAKDDKLRAGNAFESGDLATASNITFERNAYLQNQPAFSNADRVKLGNTNQNVLKAGMDGAISAGGGKLLKLNQDLKNSEFVNEIGLDEDLRQKYIVKSDKAIEAATKRAVGEATSAAKTIGSQITLEMNTLGRVTPGTKETAQNSLNSLQNVKQTPEVKEASRALELSLETTEMMEDLQGITAQDLLSMDITKGINTNNPTMADLTALNQRQKVMNNYKKKINEDPALVITSETSSIKEGTQAILEEAKRRGFPERLFTNTSEERIENVLLNTKNPSGELASLESQYPLLQQGLGQMAMKKKGLAPFVIATEMQDPISRSLILETDIKSTSEAFKQDARFEDMSAPLRREVNVVTQDMAEAFGNNDAFVNSMRQKLNAIAQQKMLRGEADSTEAAASLAYNQTFGKEFFIAQNKDSKVLINRKSQVIQSDIEAFMDSYSNPNNLIAMQEDLGIDLANQSNAQDFNSTDEFLSQVLEDDFQWRLADTRNALIPTYEANDGQRAAILDENGKPLKVLFKDLNLETGKYRQAITDKLNVGFFSGLEQTNPDAARKLQKNLEKARKKNLERMMNE